MSPPPLRSNLRQPSLAFIRLEATQAYALALEGRQWPVQVCRSARRKRIRISVNPEQLTVELPLCYPLASLGALLQRKERWLRKHLLAPEPRSWVLKEGAEVRWLGEPLRIRLQVGVAAVVRQLGELVIASAAETSPAQQRQLLTRYYQQQAFHYFSGRLRLLAPAVGVAPPPFRLSDAAHRWGSCSANGVVRIHWRLMQAPVEMSDYVLFHELTHLIEFNHSPRFWAGVERVCPDYQRLKQRFKEEGGAYYDL